MYYYLVGLLVIHLTCSAFGETVPELPHCLENNNSGLVIVSTLDGKLSALNSSGGIRWQIETGPGPLLVSNIHKLELTNNGEFVRIIPSLSGTLYKFDGNTIDPIHITAESLLKSSFRYSEDLVIAGGYEIRKYGVGLKTGKVIFECTQQKCSNGRSKDVEDVLLVERSTQIIRAVEPKTGHERWNFSVGLHNIQLPQVSCIDTLKLFDWNISAVLPEGLLRASHFKNNVENSWQYKFQTPIVNVWKWDGRELTEINLFAPKHIAKLVPVGLQPTIYVGMHDKQLYIHESVVMQNILHGKSNTDIAVAESKSIAKIPWKPFPATDEATEEDEVTALSVLNNSGYVNGNGFYLYTESDLKKKDTLLCEKNHTIKSEEIAEDSFEEIMSVEYALAWWKEVILIVATSVAMNIFLRYWNHKVPSQEIIYVERQVEVPVIERRTSERESESEFTSRYTNDFETLRCLGRGGFGVVFEVKARIDECSYAIKRITLPNRQRSKDRVMREVKALAKLDHQNIVRYFCSWVECPPEGWHLDFDQKWIPEASEAYTTTKKSTANTNMLRKKSASISIDIPGYDKDEDSLNFSDNDFNNEEDEEDSYIVFNDSKEEKEDVQSKKLVSSVSFKENSDVTSQLTVSSSLECTEELSEHMLKKINWRRPDRKHHSWDVSDSKNITLRCSPTFLYIQMQLCQKESLKEWLTSHQNRDYQRGLDIFSQILKAVEYVHLRGLIHRDLKPSNIFFSLDGQIKVGDFGLVKDMEDSLELDSKKMWQSSGYGHTVEVGTQLYMSPEQSNSNTYDYKVDIYALGLVFFELLVPFSTDMERIKTLTDLKKGEYPRGFEMSFPDEFKILKEMLCVDSDKRPTTIGIRARNPFNIKDKTYGEEYYYHLPSNQKNSQ